MFKKLLQSSELKKAYLDLDKINKLEDTMKGLSDADIKRKTEEFKGRIAAGETLEEIRVEAFALAREATFRVLAKRPYDVQMLGGLILEYGSIAEMKTGEGKTITSIAPVYLNALEAKGVLVSTVNEYLTERDAEEMGVVHEFLGLTVGINLSTSSPSQKRAAYHADITYSVHSEIGFDYLRDNMVKRPEEKVQRGLRYALIDEVDSILIDEARTPLIISGGEQQVSKVYEVVDKYAKTLSPKDYDIDSETKGIQLSDQGVDKANKFFGVENIFNVANSELNSRIQNALRANYVMSNDIDYIVKDGKIVIVDAFTGRVMEGRSYSEGLHQAIQAKEGVEIEPETKTLSTITYQNLFRMFNKLCGMSGTAKTEENEFIEIYNMRVHVIPTNRPIARIDQPDAVYATLSAKYKAIVEKVKEVHSRSQPMLIGTEEVAESEILSRKLSEVGLKHTVLNAKQNESEAEIVSKAGVFGAITIATNMAGRGTDIKLSPEAKEAGGLYVLGTSKAESRRIDNQLRGRSGRQGDVGESRFYISLEDKLISRFSNAERLKKLFASSGDKPIKAKSVVKAISRAQERIEGMNFDQRKNILQYDDVIRQQRDLIFAQRDIIISQEDLINVIQRMMKSVVNDVVLKHGTFKRKDGSYDVEKLTKVLNRVWFSLVEFKLKNDSLNGKTADEMIEYIQKELIEIYSVMRDRMLDNMDEPSLHNTERFVLLDTFDQNWQEHIDQMSKLRSSTSLASYAQKNPYQIYVERGAELFQELVERISHNTVRRLTNNPNIKVVVSEEQAKLKNAVSDLLKEK